MKNSLSDKSMMLVTYVPIGGMLGGCISVRDGGRPFYIMVSSLTVSGLKNMIRLPLSTHRNVSNSSLSSDRMEKLTSLKLPWHAKCTGTANGCGYLKLSIPASL